MIGKWLGLACVAGAGMIGAAEAQVYARIGGTASSASDLGEAVGAEAGFGLRMGGVRGELSADMMSGFAVQPFHKGLFNTEETDVSAMAAFLSLYFDFAPANSWTPYVGGGLGASLMEADNLHFTTTTGFSGQFLADNATTGFAWHLGGGVNFQMSPGVSVDIGYRYVDLGEVTFGGFASSSTPGPPPQSTSLDASEIPGNGASHQLRLAFRFG